MRAVLHTLEDFCRFLHPDCDEAAWFRSYYQLLRFADETRQDEYYREITIPKRGGGTRLLHAPSSGLMRVQRGVMRLLADAPVSPNATAYLPGRGILDNALPHCGRRMLLRLDLRDFFGQTRFPAVFRAIDLALAASPLVGPHLCAYEPEEPAARHYNSVLSFFFTRLCTLHGTLPQGAPSSPLLSNLAFEPIDREITAYCAAHDILYTRYSDDMTFSGDFSPRALTSWIERLLNRHGYALNAEKTAAAGTGQRHLVTGIVVNEAPHAGRAFRRALRQEFYYIGKYGLSDHLARRDAATGEEAAYLHSLLGKVSFVLQIEPDNREFLAYRDMCLYGLNVLLPALRRDESVLSDLPV